MMTKVRGKCGKCGKWYDYDDDLLELRAGRETWCLKCLGIESEDDLSDQVVILKREEPKIDIEFEKKLNEINFETLEPIIERKDTFWDDNIKLMDYFSSAEFPIRVWFAQRKYYFGG